MVRSEFGELHFAGAVPHEGDHPTELEGACGIDGTWTDPKLLNDRRKEETEYMRKHGALEDVDEKECCGNGCNPLTLKWVDKMNTQLWNGSFRNAAREKEWVLQPAWKHLEWT